MRSPQRTPSQNVAFSYGASTTFSKSARFIPGNETSQIHPFVVGPPLRPATPRRLPPGGGPKCLKICSKNHFLSQSRCVAGPRCWSKLLQIEAASLLGPPLRPATPRRLPPGRGAQMSQHLFNKTLFEQISVCCWPRIVVKIDPKRSFFTFGPPLPARNTSKVASGLLLGCSWAAPGCSWAAPGCSWAPPGSSWAPPHTHKYTHKPS